MKYQFLCTLCLISIFPQLLLGCSNNSNKIEKVKWDGDCVNIEDFKLIEIDTIECESFPNISETLKSPGRMKLINDSVIVYCENKEFNLLRIANLNTQNVIELLPVMFDGGRGLFSTISQIMLADEKLWLADWKDYKVGSFNKDCFDSLELRVMPYDIYRIVPQKDNKFAYMPRFKEDIRVEILDWPTETSILSKKFPPINSTGSFNNLEVQAEMNVSPDMSYFVIATLGWDFIEIYKDGKVKMIRGPFFNETRYVQQGNMEPFIIANEKKTFSCLRVGDDKFAVGIADQRLDDSERIVLQEIKTILIFSKDGQPLFRLSLPNPIYEFDIDYANNEILTLEDFLNPKLKRYKINVPLDLKQ